MRTNSYLQALAGLNSRNWWWALSVSIRTGLKPLFMQHFLSHLRQTCITNKIIRDEWRFYSAINFQKPQWVGSPETVQQEGEGDSGQTPLHQIPVTNNSWSSLSDTRSDRSCQNSQRISKSVTPLGNMNFLKKNARI